MDLRRDERCTFGHVIESLLEERDRAALYAQMGADRARLADDERAEVEREYRAWSDAAAADVLAADRIA